MEIATTYSNGGQGSTLKTSQNFIDRIYEISMKISLDFSNQPKSEPFRMPQFSLEDRDT
jgi:hypothetical protein